MLARPICLLAQACTRSNPRSSTHFDPTSLCSTTQSRSTRDSPLIAPSLRLLPLLKAKVQNLSVDDYRTPVLQSIKEWIQVACWLEDAALFSAIDHVINTFSWDEWPDPLKNRHLGALEDVQQSNKEFIYIFIAQQFLFQKQWKKIRSHAHELGITIIGDMPIYVGHHSADNREGFPILVSGVPPDAFSETGQLWGSSAIDSPLYDWRSMEDSGYTWWIQRIKRALDLYDEFRIDHFRGLAGFWAVPSEAKVAMFGRWKAGPGKAFFDAIFGAVGKINVIAEDLGVITEDVIQLRKSIGAPGMAVLQFAFGGGTDNPHLPHNHELDQVVYTGTHDNDTALGWWEGLKEEEKYHVHKYLQMSGDAKISWVLIHAAVSSVARTAIMPMQDILGLGSSARMNTPATQELGVRVWSWRTQELWVFCWDASCDPERRGVGELWSSDSREALTLAFGNWNWRIPSGLSFDKLEPEAHRIRDLLSLYNRL
ncbi:4-alpha-glucanotransferase DPE1, chloroplastic/amyloplastic [Dendrobium catenatum]|uniref:4-alpha-glucanotransferase n=1 Tax=Dendrobium catenatum TaxID=906689 RepID=A0A2I0XEI0_9ASPA|nr:4-alpha-glucanotransferase DPE1, chloroplastic/amyloplastic [Dendrobium catenatum]